MVAVGCAGGSSASEEALPEGPSRSAVTPSGVTVDLDVGSDEPRVGPVELTISLDRSLSPDQELTVDIVSPEMPSHGVLRFPAEATEDQSAFVARPHIPMEGLWMIYVNLDYGGDAAEFELRVSPAEDQEGAEHVHE